MESIRREQVVIGSEGSKGSISPRVLAGIGRYSQKGAITLFKGPIRMVHS